MESKDMLKAMGERIYRRRKELNLTQEKLSEILGVSTQMISNLELGKKAIRPENLVKLCVVLNISADYILTGNSSEMRYVDNLSEKIDKLSAEEKQIIENLVDCLNKNKK